MGVKEVCRNQQVHLLGWLPEGISQSAFILEINLHYYDIASWESPHTKLQHVVFHWPAVEIMASPAWGLVYANNSVDLSSLQTPGSLFFIWEHFFIVPNTNLAPTMSSEFVVGTYNYWLMFSREVCLLCFIPWYLSIKNKCSAVMYYRSPWMSLTTS